MYWTALQLLSLVEFVILLLGHLGQITEQMQKLQSS